MCDYCGQIMCFGLTEWEIINKFSCQKCFEKARKECIKKLKGKV